MGKGSVILMGLVFDILALFCWFLAASQASTEYIWYGIVLFVVGMVIGFIGSAMPNPDKAPIS